MEMYMFTIIVVILLVVGLAAITIVTVKSLKKEENVNINMHIEENKYQHIRDFSDINSGKKGKMVEFDNNFDEDVRTTGANLSDYIDQNRIERDFPKASPQKPNIPQQRAAVPPQMPNTSQSKRQDCFSDFDDFKTVSLDDDNSLTVSMEELGDNCDITVNMEAEPRIKVTLKYNDGVSSKILKMEADQATVGRGVGNDIIFKSDSYTSRNHALFTIRDNKLYLKDLNSKNGTYINSGQRLTGETELKENCTIKFGDAELEVYIEK